MQKIDSYMANHPLWSKSLVQRERTEKTSYSPLSGIIRTSSTSKKKVMIQIMQRNDNKVVQGSMAHMTWLPEDTISNWLIKENLVCVKTDALTIEKRCLEEASSIIDDESFSGTLKDGLEILRRYKGFQSRKTMETFCERIYRDALTNKKPNVKSPEIVSRFLDQHLFGAYMDVREASEIIQYSKYRHCEFNRSFQITGSDGDIITVRLTLFAYLLPEKKPLNLWKYHKGSILIQNRRHKGMYQTCRWSVKPDDTNLEQ